MMDEVAAALRARIEVEPGADDPGGLLSPEADAEAAKLVADGLQDAGRRGLLAEFLWARYGFTRSVEDLGRAAELTGTLLDHPELRPPVLSMLLSVVGARVGDPASVTTLPGDPQTWAGTFYTLAVAWAGTDTETQNEHGEWDRIIAAMSLAFDLAPEGQPGRRRAAVSMADYRVRRGRLRGDPGEIADAVQVLRRELTATVDDDPERAVLAGMLAGALHAAFEVDPSTAARVELAQSLFAVIDDDAFAAIARSISDVDEETDPADPEQAVTLARLGVAATAGPGRPWALFRLAAALSRRAAQTRSLPDSTEAIVVQQQMTALLVEEPERQIELGIAHSYAARHLWQRYELAGDVADARQAVEAARNAAGTLPPGQEPAAVNNAYLGTFLFFLHELDDDPAVLDEAEAALLAASAVDTPEQARTMSMLSAVHLNRYRRTRRDENLDEAVTFGRRAIAVDPDDPGAVARLGNLGTALRMRYELTGNLGDLDEAIVVVTEALERIPSDHADHARLTRQLRSAQLQRSEHSSESGGRTTR